MAEMKYQVLETYVEKISNVSRYEFTSIAVYKLVGLYSLSANLS